MQAGLVAGESPRPGSTAASPAAVGCWHRAPERSVLTDNLATGVDAVGDRRTDAGHWKIEAAELPVREQEPVLRAAGDGDVEADDVAARIDAFGAGLCCHLAGRQPRGTGGGGGRGRALNVYGDEPVWLCECVTGQHERRRDH